MALRFRHRAGGLLAFSLASMLAVTAVAQRGGAPAETVDRPPDVEVRPRGQHMPRNITYSTWRKLCFQDTLGKIVCRTTTSGNWDTGQMAVRIDLIERKGDDATRVQIFLPVGLYLRAGVKLLVDEEMTAQIPYSWCLSNTCIAGSLLAPRLVGAMEAGRKLTLEVVDSNLLTVATSVSLDQFGTAHKGAAAKIYAFPDNEQ